MTLRALQSQAQAPKVTGVAARPEELQRMPYSRGGPAGSRKGIKHGMMGRDLNQTEHWSRGRYQ